MFAGVYKDRGVFLTGHTGFKGSWLALWLETLGARVSGYSLPPATEPNHWDLLGLECAGVMADIRDAARLKEELCAAAPEIVFHLAAQPLVRASYADPLTTWETNVMGTANLLEVCRHCPSVRAVVVVTTDKCYENKETGQRYTEEDRLGGHDPYSASKAGTELVVDSYRKSFFRPAGVLLASARAGNVIGGGDWSQDRLIPDLARAAASRRGLVIRNPQATRPWQHVLEALGGYLRLGQRLIEGRDECAGPWNFGPGPDGNRTVEDVLRLLSRSWQISWERDSCGDHPHEAGLLQLDSGKARDALGWTPLWTLEEGLGKTAEWYNAYINQGAVISRRQLEEYCKALGGSANAWAA